MLEADEGTGTVGRLTLTGDGEKYATFFITDGDARPYDVVDTAVGD